MKQDKNQKLHKSTHMKKHHIRKRHSKLRSSNEYNEFKKLIDNLPATNVHNSESSPQLNIPVLATDYVANMIQLIDMAKMPTLAKIDYVITLLDELFRISLIFPNIGKTIPVHLKLRIG
ncbi:MAG: hypothetical protein GPJ54_17145 [Candidatus Heimdallarchaeota archaeon]|nr:hypothetical protein [Candidatus Heimdallarchaeota archaeon]